MSRKIRIVFVIFLAVSVMSAVHWLPLSYTTSMSNVTRRGSQVSANVHSGNQNYFVTGLTSNDGVLITGVYDSSGTPEAFYCQAQVPMSSANAVPLRIPECSAGGIEQPWISYCVQNPGNQYCATESFLSVYGHCVVPLYGGGCSPTVFLHLATVDAINGQAALALIAFMAGVVGIVLAPPAGAAVAILPAVLNLFYTQMYSNDKDADGGFSFWVPISWQNLIAYEGATPDYWWNLNLGTIIASISPPLKP